MSTISQKDFTDSLFQLLRETFEGPPAGVGSAYLDKGAGLFQTLDALSAADASRGPWPGASTVAAHCEHARFYVHALLDFMRGATEKVDWGRSWLVREVSADEWDGLRAAPAWRDEEVGDSMAILAHTAYHLGAIRQLAAAATKGRG